MKPILLTLSLELLILGAIALYGMTKIGLLVWN
jgi:hypothetical protein